MNRAKYAEMLRNRAKLKTRSRACWACGGALTIAGQTPDGQPTGIFRGEKVHGACTNRTLTEVLEMRRRRGAV